MSKIKFDRELRLLLKNIKKIPDEFFIRTDGGKYRVIWFMDRQRPSVEASYDFDMERFGVTKEGLVIYGFDSGCSCPSPWSKEDYGDEHYSVKTWKEFLVDSTDKIEQDDKSEDSKKHYTRWFDVNWDNECYNNLQDYLLLLEEDIEPLKVLEVKNAEIRRFLMKRIGYDKIRNHAKVNIINTDGTSELLDINGDKYVKVKDSSTAREYLLYVPSNIKNCKEGIAWTFGLNEKEYNPLIET